MKKALSVFLAALMILASLSTLAFAAEKFPAPAAPDGLLFADGMASWNAVEGADYYKVRLLNWNFDEEYENWRYIDCGFEIKTTENFADLSEELDFGKYIFSVTAYKEYELEKDDGTVTTYTRFSEKALYDGVPCEAEFDIYSDVDSNIPFEQYVDENDETGNMLLDFLRTLKKIVVTILQFFGFVGETTGLTDQIFD